MSYSDLDEEKPGFHWAAKLVFWLVVLGAAFWSFVVKHR
jgi:hypothetical protein